MIAQPRILHLRQPATEPTCEESYRSLRILIVNWRCPRNPQAGGAETHLHQIARRLVAWGHRVTVLCSGWQSGNCTEAIDGVIYRRIGTDRSFLWRYRRVYRQLCNYVRFDLVIDDISKIPLAVPAIHQAKRIAWCHHIHGPMLYRQLPAPLAWWIARRERQIPDLYRDVPILAVSRSTHDELATLGVPAHHLGYVPNGVDIQTIQSHRTTKSRTPLLVYLGRLQRYKNVDCVIRAFARIRAATPSAQLVILGRGEDEQRLRNLARQICPEGIDFCGYVDDAIKYRTLSRAWVVMASSMKEGWGICILEANAVGTPVVASNVPGHRDAIAHDRTGLLYPFDDDATMARQITDLLVDRERLAAFRQQGRLWAERFSWERSAVEFLLWVEHFHPELGSVIPQHLRYSLLRHHPRIPLPKPQCQIAVESPLFATAALARR